MTDEQIMQGLKWCYQVEGSCGDCPYRPDDLKKAKCHDRLGNDVIALINRQRAEIKALKMDKEQLESDISNALGNLDHMTQLYEGAIKEFADKLKSKTMKMMQYDEGGWGCEIYVINTNDMDNLAKEMGCGNA